jgi:hypothetical protein
VVAAPCDSGAAPDVEAADADDDTADVVWPAVDEGRVVGKLVASDAICDRLLASLMAVP